jgi:hypothetical protein
MDSNLRYTALEVSKLNLTPPMRFIYYIKYIYDIYGWTFQSKLRSGTSHYTPLYIDILFSAHGAFLEDYLHQVR